MSERDFKNFKLGADPEFALCLPHSSAHSTALARFFSEDDSRNTGLMGTDGCGRILELRPEPDENPLVVVNRIREILLSFANTRPILQDYIWKAGSRINRDTLGGHIHFGFEKEGDGYQAWQGNFPLNIELFMFNLAYFVGIPCTLVEKSRDARFRRRYYGQGLDYRIQLHGLEFRSPSSWLSSPYAAAAALCLSKVVGYELFKIVKASQSPFFQKYSPDSMFLVYLNTVNRTQLTKLFFELWPKIQKMELYPLYEKYLELFPLLISKKLSWNTNDMKKSWGLYKDEVKIPSLEDVWKRYSDSLISTPT